VRGILAEGAELLQALSAAAEHGDHEALPVSDVRLLAPIQAPEKILCLGLNYREHTEETRLEQPPVPTVFAKFANCLIGPADPIVLPDASSEIDYEAELAVVIGRVCRGVAPEAALDHVAGAMAFNDVTARDVQFQTSQWTLGKAIDTFAPCGPSLVLLDEIENLQELSVQARVNGDVVQSDTTGSMITTVADAVAQLSQRITLVPGDIIATGTPAGVGYTRKPPLFLNNGDLVEIEIEGIGCLRNRVESRAGDR
jgi:2-keto-4-pentenoate hydratase/2-oxohepta-3-ene-1,7-dioic acid hydratase in catechol pathway